MEPITRKETYLARAAGDEAAELKPLTRTEHFLAKIAGDDVTVPEPITREEMFMQKIIDGGGPTITVEPLSVTENGTYTAEEGKAYSPVTVNTPEPPELDTLNVNANGSYTPESGHAFDEVNVNVPSGIVSVDSNDVNFLDYDGTIVASYSAADFANLTEMPENPSHAGLTAQGWNWTLVDAKQYVADFGALDIGQMYVTDDGDSRFYIEIEEGDSLVVALNIYQNEASGATIDWGDGTPGYTRNASGDHAYNHIYSHPGKYIISLHINKPSCVVILGFSESSADGYGFIRDLGSGTGQTRIQGRLLRRVEIGTNISILKEYVFSQCFALSTITIPKTVTDIKTYAFNNCYSLRCLIVPNEITAINNYMCYFNTDLSRVSIPASIVGSIGDGAFYYCTSLKRIQLPKNLTTIGSNVFRTIGALGKITIPANVTSIGTYAFNACYSLAVMRCLPTTPPVVSNANAFTNLPSEIKIYVPAASLNAYKTATNWSTLASNMVADPT